MLLLRSSVMGCLAGVETSNQAAVELQVSLVLLLRVDNYAEDGVAGERPIKTVELIDGALVDRVRSFSSC